MNLIATNQTFAPATIAKSTIGESIASTTEIAPFAMHEDVGCQPAPKLQADQNLQHRLSSAWGYVVSGNGY
jgi:hypothetical protein